MTELVLDGFTARPLLREPRFVGDLTVFHVKRLQRCERSLTSKCLCRYSPVPQVDLGAPGGGISRSITHLQSDTQRYPVRDPTTHTDAHIHSARVGIWMRIPSRYSYRTTLPLTRSASSEPYAPSTLYSTVQEEGRTVRGIPVPSPVLPLLFPSLHLFFFFECVRGGGRSMAFTRPGTTDHPCHTVLSRGGVVHPPRYPLE